MQHQPSEIDILSRRVKQGDVPARERLRHLLLPELALIVKHTLRSGRARSAMAQRIFHEYHQVADPAPAPRTMIPPTLIEQVARRLTEQMVAGLENGSDAGAGPWDATSLAGATVFS